MLDSELLLVALLACLSVMVLTSVWKQRSLQGKLPPGPTPLPFIRNFLQLEKNKIYSSFMKVTPGPVFTIHLGTFWVVVCGYEAVKEVLVDQAEEFNGRGQQATFDCLFKGYGVAFSNRERTKQLKRFCLHVLRELGMGKRGTEHRIQQEADFLIEALGSTRSTFIDRTFHLSKMVANIMRSIVFGDRSDYDDKEFLSLLWMMGETLNFAASPMGQVSEIFHAVMKHLPGPQQQAFKNMQRLEEFTAKRVEQNQCTQLPINSLRIILTEFYKKNLVLAVLDFFTSVSQSSSRTTLFRLILFVKHPDVEGKTGGDQEVHEETESMPYTQAVIHEIQRFTNVGPWPWLTGSPRTPDFGIPSFPRCWPGTDVIRMLCSLLSDPRFFSTPDDFNPQHFLDDKGLKKIDAHLPFSMGKQSCLGEGLATMEALSLPHHHHAELLLQAFPRAPGHKVVPKPQGSVRVPPNFTMSFLPR
uniref:Cytochrome P450 n=1 Tax=Sciurus vulgaris TaxID=55149 RepID=A0A8D2JNV5_SCIVU